MNPNTPDPNGNPDHIMVWDFIEQFAEALVKQLKSDYPRWGDTWLKRTREGQEQRTWNNYKDKFDKYFNGENSEPIPWLKIAGDAMICWIREQHPEIWPK